MRETKKNIFDILIGNKIENIYISDDKYSLAFECNGKYLIYETENDCCNEVWFNHITGMNNILESKIIDIVEKDWQEVCDDNILGKDDYEDVILWTIKTEKGYFDIDVRNNHNGYYCGNVHYIEAETKIPENFKIIIEDF